MTDEGDESKSNADLDKFKLLMEKVNELPWSQRKVPHFLINPCTQSYEAIQKVMVDLYDGGKIKKVIIEHGKGDVLPPNASVYLHYACYVEEKKIPYDSSLLRSLTPKHYQLGGGFMFSGFEIAVSSMRENETAQFLIHPDHAYGKLGCPPRIPGNVPIMLIINVTDFIDCGYVTLKKGDKDVDFLTYQEKFKVAKSHSALAVDYYKYGRIKMAFHHFREAQYTLDEEADTRTEESERQDFLQKSFVNQMMCLSHPKYLKPKKLIEVANRAEKDLPELVKKNAKFHYCLGVAYTHLQEYADASESFKKAQMLSPFLPRLGKAMKYLHEKAGKALTEEKALWRGAFSKLGYSPVTDMIEQEPEDTVGTRKQINETLARCLENKNFSYLKLRSGFTKIERQILSAEAEKLGLIYEQYVEGCQIFVEIKKKKA